MGSEMQESIEAQSEDALRFFKSLQELKELRSQIHHAADYCEATFLKSEDKAAVMDNTKEYISKALVTVIDHLGNVSSNLNYRLLNSAKVSETELRINCLKQKLLSHEQYNHELVFSKLRLRSDFRIYNPRYILPPTTIPEKASEEASISSLILREREEEEATVVTGNNKPEFRAEEDVPLFMYTSTNKVSSAKDTKECDDSRVHGANLTSVLPVLDGLCNQTKARNPSFQFQKPRKHGRRILNWRQMHKKEFLSLIRRSKKELSKFSRA